MDTDAVLNAIEEGLTELIKNAAKTFSNEAERDLKAFVKESEEDIRRYAKLFAEGKLSQFELKFLMKMKTDNAELLAISAKGIARARIKHLMNSMKDLIVSTILAAV
ncbi:hypothetical protein [Shimia sp. MMG029]|uniref:hypothetical protein n=1 Tax=Shimia sp. MMG029 TaxID=3021978 RepID=UPI0022FEF331|nr:hypothetical protein [Shimia sp. MMG029]MDA5556221.1 hypothetical protein [Shimia sp. MMG029]